MLERVVYCILCISLVGYIAKRCLKIKSNINIGLLGLQIIGIIVEILTLINGIYPENAMRAYIVIINVLIPSIIFILDYKKIDASELFLEQFGDFYMRKGKYEKAIANFNRAAEKKPSNKLYVKLGKAYNGIGDRRTAFDKFAKAIELDRNDYKSYYEIGIIFNELGKKNDAQLVLDNTLRIKPDYTPASELLAVVLCSQNKYDEAINVYKNAIKYDPDNYQLYYSLGIVRTELRDFDEASNCYKKAIELKSDLYEAYYSLGQIYLLKGELNEAEAKFKKAALDPETAAKAYYQLAKTYILNSDEIKAVNYIEYAIEIDPGYRYKAESEPLFKSIKDYLTGMHMVSQAQMKLEQEIDEKVKEKYEKEYDNIKINDNITEDDVEFNFMDKYKE